MNHPGTTILYLSGSGWQPEKTIINEPEKHKSLGILLTYWELRHKGKKKLSIQERRMALVLGQNVIWIHHPESESVFQGIQSDLEKDGNLHEVSEEEAMTLLKKYKGSTEDESESSEPTDDPEDNVSRPEQP